MRRLVKLVKIWWPILIIIGIVFVFYQPFFTKGLLPIPADITPGMYYPWFDDKFPEFPNNIPVKNHLPSDIVSLTYPLRLLSVSLMKIGEWPLWNSLILCGTPLLANFQSAALYPLNFVYWISDNFSTAWAWQVIAQPLLGMLFTFWFLRSFTLSRTASLFGAITWATGSFFSIWGQYNTVFQAILYLPLALMAIKKMENTYGWGILAAAALAMSIYAGNPPMTLVLIITVAVYCLVFWEKDIKKYLGLGMWAILGIGLAAPVLIPGYINSTLSIRQSDNVAIDNNIKYLPIRQILTLVAPDFYGNPTTLNYWAPGLYDNLTLFVGVIPMLLFLMGIYIKLEEYRKLKLFSMIVFWGSWLLIIRNPVSEIVGGLPVLGLSSMVMSRFFSVTSFAMALGVALTIEHILLSKKSYRIAFPVIIVGTLIVVPSVITLLTNLVFKNGFRMTNLIPEPGLKEMSIVINNTMVSVRNSILPALLLTITSILLFLGKRFNPKIIVTIMLLLTVFDLNRFFKKYNSFVPEKYLYPQNKSIDYLKENSARFVREGGELLPSNMWMPYGLRSVSGYDTLHSARYNGFVSMINGSSIEKTTNRYLEVDNFNASQVDFLGVTHLVALKRNDGRVDTNGDLSVYIDQKKYEPVFEDRSTVVLKNKKSIPIVFAVSEYAIAGNLSEMNMLLKEKDLTKTVILEKAPTLVKVDGRVIISDLKVSGQKTSLQTSSENNQILVTSQTYDPGWRLVIDGKKSEILRANHAFMAFEVPNGKHSIELTYQPDSFYLGLKILMLSTVIGIAMTGWGFLRRK